MSIGVPQGPAPPPAQPPTKQQPSLWQNAAGPHLQQHPHPSLKSLAEDLVGRVEEACFAGRELTSNQLSPLNDLRDVRLWLDAGTAQESARLRLIGHRLWCACAAQGAAAAFGSGDGVSSVTEAKLRTLACELFNASSKGGSAPVSTDATGMPGDTSGFPATSVELTVLAAQWALAGRAWVLAGDAGEALRCFDEASKPWFNSRPKSGVALNSTSDVPTAPLTRLAEVAVQAQIWASDVHFKRCAYPEALAALVDVRDALAMCTELKASMLDELLRTCYEQARAHRRAGNPLWGVELLTFAVAALGPGSFGSVGNAASASVAGTVDAASHCQLLRQLALCHAAGGARSVALAYARKAVSVAPHESVHCAASLNVLLRLALQNDPGQSCVQDAAFPRDPTAEGTAQHDVQEVVLVADNLMQHPAAAVVDCLAACDFMLENHLGVKFVLARLAKLAARLSSRTAAASVGHVAETVMSERLNVLQFQLRVAIRNVEMTMGEDTEASSSAEGLLRELFATADIRAVTGGPTVASKELLKLGAAAYNSGKMEFAAKWLLLAAPFLSANAELADCLAAVALCAWRAGSPADARTYVKQALDNDSSHLQATLLSLLTAENPQHEGETSTLLSLLSRLHSYPGLRPQHVLCVARTLLDHSVDDISFAGLDLLVNSLTRRESGDSVGTALSGLRVGRELLERAVAQHRSDKDVVRYLDVLASHLSGSELQASIAREFVEGEGPNASEVKRIVDAAWSHGLKFAGENRWPSCANVFEGIHRLLEHLDSVEILELFEARAWCLGLAASAILQCMDSRPCMEDASAPKQEEEEKQTSLCSRALRYLSRAHGLCRRMDSVAPASVGGRADGSSTNNIGSKEVSSKATSFSISSAAGRKRSLFIALVLLEFEARCRSGESEALLKRFADEASSQDAVGMASLLAMSRIAATSVGRELSIHCMQRYLRVCVGAGGAGDYAQSAAAYREMIALYGSRNESFAVYDGLKNLLCGSRGGDSSSPGMEEEVAWLVATAWNNGKHFAGLQQYRWAERWLSTALSLARLCSGHFPEEEMQAGYVECLQLCAD